MNVIGGPTYDDWLQSSFWFKCSVTVKCKDGETQDIDQCDFSYGFKSKEKIVSKRGCKISDFFFVESVISVHSFESLA